MSGYEGATQACGPDRGINSVSGRIEKVSPTLELIGHLRESQEQTHSLLETLHSKLDGALLPIGPENSKAGTATPQPLRSPLCDELQRRVDSEHGIHAHIQNLIDRLTI